MTMSQHRQGKREGRKDPHRSSPFHYLGFFIISNKRDSTSPTFYRSANMNPNSFLPKLGGGDGGERNGMAY